jgi:hypothetical protein
MRSVVALILSLVPQQSVGLGVLVAVDQILKHPIVTAQIRGRVFDEYGASIPDASVSFEPVDQRSELTPFGAVADSRGRFDFAGIRPGTYRITCKALGFETTVLTEEVVAGEENDITVVVRRRQSQTAASASRSSSP